MSKKQKIINKIDLTESILEQKEIKQQIESNLQIQQKETIKKETIKKEERSSILCSKTTLKRLKNVKFNIYFSERIQLETIDSILNHLIDFYMKNDNQA